MAIAVALLLLAVAVAHGYNMLHYPYLEDDEGTYFSQAWAVFHLGKLAPYTYIYDHAPLGWIQIALWQMLSGGLRFGYGLASGRVLMLLFQLGSTLLTFCIGRRASGKLWVGLAAAALAALLPFGIQYQRRILLDNVCTFWLLVSVYALTGPVTLRRVWLSAVAVGLAVLSKEIAVAVLPALAVMVARRSPVETRLIAVTGWLGLSLSVCSTYLLLALVKGEFFPAGTALGGSHPHVSLICSLMWQSARGSDGGLLSPSSGFWRQVSSWVWSEPVLTVGGTAGMAYLIVGRRHDAFAAMLGWTVLSLWVFLGRGGIIQGFYLIPLLPLLALCLTLTADAIVSGVRRIVSRPRLARVASGGVLALTLTGVGTGTALAYRHSGDALWTADPVRGQEEAVTWVQQHLPRSSRIVIDNYMWYDLHVPASGAPFKDAIYYWNVGFDPGLRRDVFGDNWRTVNYVISTPQMVHDLTTQAFPVVTPAFEHSVMVRSFDTGGWTVEVRRVDQTAPNQLPHASATKAQQSSCMTYGT